MNFLSGREAEEPTVYGWNTKVSAPLLPLIRIVNTQFQVKSYFSLYIVSNIHSKLEIYRRKLKDMNF